jgi:Protein of unknown function (DUF1501)
MLTLWGGQRAFCDGIGRRSFLRVGALGGVLTLADLLRLRAAGRPKDAPGAAKSVIMIYLDGGCCHLDTYDLKPNAPIEIRGPFRPITTKVPGIMLCEFFPRQAAIADKLAVIRSVVGMEDSHTDDQVMSGWGSSRKAAMGQPSLGAVVSKLRGLDIREEVPPFVSLRRLTPGLEPGNLGVGHRLLALNVGPAFRHLDRATLGCGR